MHGDTMNCMSTLQVREVPEDVRRVLKQRAAAAGQSLSEYVLGELRRLTSQPSIEELSERVRLRGSSEPDTPAAAILRAERGAIR